MTAPRTRAPWVEENEPEALRRRLMAEYELTEADLAGAAELRVYSDLTWRYDERLTSEIGYAERLADGRFALYSSTP